MPEGCHANSAVRTTAQVGEGDPLSGAGLPGGHGTRPCPSPFGEVMLDSNHVLSIDAESNGLGGQAFCVAMVLYDDKGNEVDCVVERCPIKGDVDDWVRINVLPQITHIEQTHDSYRKMLSS